MVPSSHSRDGNNVMSKRTSEFWEFTPRHTTSGFLSKKEGSFGIKTRQRVRMIEFDHSLGANWAYQDTDPANSNWGVKRASMFCVMLLTSLSILNVDLVNCS